MTVLGIALNRRPRLRSDSGQVAVEFLGMLPTIIITLVLLWQAVLVGYTFTLAGNAADEAVRAGTAAQDRQAACEREGRRDLPSAWRGGDINCGADAGGYVTADVYLEVPVLFPGSVGFPFPRIHGHAGAVEEAK